LDTVANHHADEDGPAKADDVAGECDDGVLHSEVHAAILALGRCLVEEQCPPVPTHQQSGIPRLTRSTPVTVTVAA
jgi:hypothetical protein